MIIIFMLFSIPSTNYGIDHRTTLGRHHSSTCRNKQLRVYHWFLRPWLVGSSPGRARKFIKLLFDFREWYCWKKFFHKYNHFSSAGWESRPVVLSFFALLSIHFPLHRYTPQLWKTFFCSSQNNFFLGEKRGCTLQCGAVWFPMNWTGWWQFWRVLFAVMDCVHADRKKFIFDLWTNFQLRYAAGNIWQLQRVPAR